MSVKAVQPLLDEGLRQGVYTSARVEIRQASKTQFTGGAGPAELFDLASLTKILSTTALFLALWSEKALAPEDRLERWFPESPARGATLADLLFHRSGLPAWKPFFLDALKAFPRLVDPECPALLRDEARRFVAARALETPLSDGTTTVYSDLGFIALGEVLERTAGAPLDALFAKRIAAPLNLSAHFRPMSRQPTRGASGDCPPTPLLAATGALRPRESAVGQPPLPPKTPRGPSCPGEVDDDNCWAMDGIAGHAGLFGTAADVAGFGQAVLDGLRDGGPIAPASLWAQAVQRDPRSARALGFDTPSEVGSSAGRHLKRAVGHLGFTGTSLWIDLDRQLVVALLTNGSLLGRGDHRVRQFRPQFHDAVVEALST
jgi:CubicO group peptidase (beta-lactamase class C family)